MKNIKILILFLLASLSVNAQKVSNIEYCYDSQGNLVTGCVPVTVNGIQTYLVQDTSYCVGEDRHIEWDNVRSGSTAWIQVVGGACSMPEVTFEYNQDSICQFSCTSYDLLVNQYGLDSLAITEHNGDITIINDTDTHNLINVLTGSNGLDSVVVTDVNGLIQQFVDTDTWNTVSVLTGLNGLDSIVTTNPDGVSHQFADTDTDTWNIVDVSNGFNGLDSVTITNPDGTQNTFIDTVWPRDSICEIAKECVDTSSILFLQAFDGRDSTVFLASDGTFLGDHVDTNTDTSHNTVEVFPNGISITYPDGTTQAYLDVDTEYTFSTDTVISNDTTYFNFNVIAGGTTIYTSTTFDTGGTGNEYTFEDTTVVTTNPIFGDTTFNWTYVYENGIRIDTIISWDTNTETDTRILDSLNQTTGCTDYWYVSESNTLAEWSICPPSIDDICELIDSLGCLPPVTNHNSAVTALNTPVVINYCDNDFGLDSDIDPTIIFKQASSNGGTFVDNGDCTATYTPPAGSLQNDTIPYCVVDQEGDTSNVSLLTVEIEKDPIVDISHQSTTNPDNLVTDIQFRQNDSPSVPANASDCITLTLRMTTPSGVVVEDTHMGQWGTDIPTTFFDQFGITGGVQTWNPSGNWFLTGYTKNEATGTPAYSDPNLANDIEWIAGYDCGCTGENIIEDTDVLCKFRIWHWDNNTYTVAGTASDPNGFPRPPEIGGICELNGDPLALFSGQGYPAVPTQINAFVGGNNPTNNINAEFVFYEIEDCNGNTFALSDTTTQAEWTAAFSAPISEAIQSICPSFSVDGVRSFFAPTLFPTAQIIDTYGGQAGGWAGYWISNYLTTCDCECNTFTVRYRDLNNPANTAGICIESKNFLDR